MNLKTSSIYLLLIAVVLLGCKSNNDRMNEKNTNTRSCVCPVENLPDERIFSDSTISKSTEDDLFDWEIGGKISSKITKVIDAEIHADLNSNSDNYEISTKKIVERITNDFPQLIDKAYFFKLNRVFYCAFYSILCKDTSISDSELRIASLEKLEEFRNETLKIIKIHSESGVKKTNNKNLSDNISLSGNNNNQIAGNNNKQENKKIETQFYIENQTGGSNYVINPKIDVPKPNLEIIEVINTNKIEIKNDSTKVYKNIIKAKLTTEYAITSFDFRVEGEDVIALRPNANFIFTYEPKTFKSSGKIAFIRLIAPQSGIYELEVVSTRPIINILQRFEGHWNNNFFRF